MAGIFGDCAGCATRDTFIAFLQKQNQDFAAKLAEVASPGANARQHYTQPAPRPEPTGPKATHSPARIAATRSDKATPPDAPTVRVSEADFERH